MTTKEVLPTLAITPPSLAFQAKSFVVGSLLLAAAAMFLPWIQTAEGAGQVIPLSPQDRVQRIDAPITGRIDNWHVIEGDRVKKGEVLASLIDVDPSYFDRLQKNLAALEAGQRAANAQIASYEGQVTAQRTAGGLAVDAARQKVGMARQKVEAAKQSWQAAVASLEVSEVNAKRVEGLVNEGLSSQRDYELAQLKVAETKAGMNKAQAAVREAEASLLAYQAAYSKARADALVKVASSQAAVQKAARDAAKAAEDVTKTQIKVSRQSSQIVQAPVTGTVLWVNHEISGGLVKEGTKLMVVVPDHARPAVELWMDGNDLPLLRQGREVRLQFEGWPSVQFDGWPSIAVGTFPGVVRAVDSASQRAGKFRIVVVPATTGDWPAENYLRQGVRARGIVLLDEVSIGYEVWRRINDFPSRLANQPDDKSEGATKADAPTDSKESAK